MRRQTNNYHSSKSFVIIGAMKSKTIKHTITIPAEYAGLRLDQAIAKLLPEYSRMRIKEWLENKNITINQAQNWRAKDKVKGNEEIELKATLQDETFHAPEAIDLNIVYEDDELIIINKPVGMVVHPAPGNRHHTLLNALLHHAPLLSQLPRAGIIHRLDKDTSGLLVIAKTLPTHTYLVKQLQDRLISREYEAIIQGTLTGGGTIETNMGRHPHKRTQMAVTESGKPAITHYWIIEKFNAHTHIKVKLETGRTHQIRVHMAHLHHPIVGDTTYGGRMKIPAGASETLIDALQNFKRQALHAKRLAFIHPITLQEMQFEAEIPDDMQQLLNILKEDAC